MPGEDQEHIQKHITWTIERLQEIQAESGSIAQKQARASVNLCFLLQEIAATSFPLDAEAEVTKLVGLFMNMR